MTAPHLEPVTPADSDRFRAAIRAFDAANALDPNRVVLDGADQPAELLYARRLTDWVLRLCPDASETLRLAARCQHLCRWMIPRSAYEASKAGYLKWRNDLKHFHAEKAAALLAEAGWDADTIGQVRALNLKSGFPQDPESRILEDALCLVFLEFQLGDLASKSPEDKIVNALKKSWNKMRPEAREIALTLKYAERERRLLNEALGVR
jgi:hypothetical protein